MGGTGEGGDFGDERLRTAPVTVRCLLFFDLFFDLRPSLMTESLPFLRPSPLAHDGVVAEPFPL